jgi:hypothetical protein
MKVDRFVKVMLVLIAVLLALNCAKDLNLSSNSRGSSSNLSPNSGRGNSAASSNTSGGNSRPVVFESSVEAAVPPSFLQVGKSYQFPGLPASSVEVLEIQSPGWVKVNIERYLMFDSFRQ